MLDRMRDNEAAVQAFPQPCHAVLCTATHHLKILNPVRGDKELVRLVAVELAKLSRG